MDTITYEEFKKMDIRVGMIMEVEPVPDTDKLLRCQIDFNEKDEEGKSVSRQIISGIREFYPDYTTLVGKKVLYIVNLESRMIKGYESKGMLMAVDSLEGTPVFLIPETSVVAGARVR